MLLAALLQAIKPFLIEQKELGERLRAERIGVL